MEKLRVGIVGLGRLGREYVKNLAYHIPNAELLAVCSVVSEEVEAAQSQYNIPFGYLDYTEMLGNKALQAIVIVSTTDRHAEQIIQALEAGLHVFCEKPLSLSIEDCRSVQAVADRHPDLIKMIGYVRRYDPSYADARRKLEQGLIGKPVFVQSQTVDKDTVAEFLLKGALGGGGIFHDYNVHDIDLVQWFLGSKIKTVWALGGAYRFREFGEIGDADNTFALCQLENGTTGFIGASRVSPFGHNTLSEIVATEGNIRIGDPPQRNLVRIADRHGVRHECFETFFDRFEEAFRLQIQDFVNHVQEGKQPMLDIENATSTTAVATALTLSFKEKRLVEVAG